MKTKIIIIAGLAAIGVVVVMAIKTSRVNAPAVTTVSILAPAQPKTPPPEKPVVQTIPPKITGQAEPQAAPKTPVQTQTTGGDQPLVINGYEVQDPLARAALNSVGKDPAANAYWVSAINDPSLPSEERKDLIEDLNEDGLSDPHNPGPQDMPLIAARIRLIESLAPSAMDQVDAKAFAEAEKDLTGMMNGQIPQ